MFIYYSAQTILSRHTMDHPTIFSQFSLFNFIITRPKDVSSSIRWRGGVRCQVLSRQDTEQQHQPANHRAKDDIMKYSLNAGRQADGYNLPFFGFAVYRV